MQDQDSNTHTEAAASPVAETAAEAQVSNDQATNADNAGEPVDRSGISGGHSAD